MPIFTPARTLRDSGIRFSSDAPQNIVWPVLTALALFITTYF